MQNNAEVFTNIYTQNRWGSTESVSGRGSEMVQTVEVRAVLASVLSRYAVSSMVDAPCGDFNWMRHVMADFPHVAYTGIDIVEPIIQKLQNEYTDNDQLTFERRDITTDPLPEADLILSRDCLVHLGLEDGVNALANFKRSGARFLLATQYPAIETNSDTENGHWRPINMELSPYSLPVPIEVFDTDYRDNGRNYPGNHLALWDLQAIPEVRPSQK